MKKVINKKVYDTAKSQLIHRWDSKSTGGKEYQINESLYLTKKGQYFILGNGGGMTNYALNGVSQGKTKSFRFWIVSRENAIAWLESHEGDKILLEHNLFKGIVKEG